MKKKFNLMLLSILFLKNTFTMNLFEPETPLKKPSNKSLKDFKIILHKVKKDISIESLKIESLKKVMNQKEINIPIDPEEVFQQCDQTLDPK